MRLISTDKLLEGMVISKAIFNEGGNVLLGEGIELKWGYIDKLKKLGIEQVYIKDKFTGNEEIDLIIKQETKSEALNLVEKIMTSEDFSSEVLEEDIVNVVKNIVSDVMEKKDVVVKLLEIRSVDNYTFEHNVNVAVLSILTGMTMEYTKDQLLNLAMGAILHDIGKSKVPIDILNKPSRLTEEEYTEIKKHVNYGHDMVKKEYSFNRDVLDVILSHHERFDGTGYPNKLKGKEIHEFARIVSIADVYDALTSNRVYKVKASNKEAINYLEKMSGKQFDPDILKKFVCNVSVYPIGTNVKLSNGERGYVIDVRRGYVRYPLVNVIYDELGNKLMHPYILDLKENKEIYILD